MNIRSAKKESLKFVLENISLQRLNKIEIIVDLLKELDIERLTFFPDFKENISNIFISGRDYNPYKISITKELLPPESDCVYESCDHIQDDSSNWA